MGKLPISIGLNLLGRYYDVASVMLLQPDYVAFVSHTEVSTLPGLAHFKPDWLVILVQLNYCVVACCKY
jgi:hypothetical protein